MLPGEAQRGAGGEHSFGHFAAQALQDFQQRTALAQPLANCPVAAEGARAGEHQIPDA